MSDLRKTQRARRHREIVHAAGNLFVAEGYSATALKDVAFQADVSVATLYNYYDSKAGLLTAVLMDEGMQVIEAGASLITKGPVGLDLFVDLALLYVDHPLSFMPRERWAEALSIAASGPETRHGKAYAEIDLKLREQMADLSVRLHDEGLLVSERGRLLGEIAFNNVNQLFTEYVTGRPQSRRSFRSSVRTQTQLLLDLASGPQ